MAASRKKHRRVTLQDVAREAGVSRATASLVIRKSPLVGKETRQRVEQVLEKLGYVYNLGAARMRAEKSHTVGVIVPNLSNPFFADMLAGIERALGAANMVVILANSDDSRDKQATIIRRMREHGVDGLIVCPAAGTGKTLPRQAAEWGLPLVQTMRLIPGSAGDYAGTDDVGGMRQALNYLKSLGHMRIAFLTGGSVHSAYSERLAAFRSVAAEISLDDGIVVNIPLTQSDATEAARMLVGMKPSPTAAVCHNDVVALGLSSGFYDLGVEVGRDFSIVGFDDLTQDSYVRPKLTSVATHPLEVGESAARLLLDRLDIPERPGRRVINLPTLVVRQSCGPNALEDAAGLSSDEWQHSVDDGSKIF